MPDITVVGLTERAVAWPFRTARTGKAEPLLNPFREYRARFTRRASRSTDAKGNTVAVDAQCALPASLAVASIVWEGGLSTVPLVTSPTTDAGTSVSSLTVAAGNVAFTLASALTPFTVGRKVLARSVADPSLWMAGTVVSEVGLVLTVSVTETGEDGTASSWVIGVPSPTSDLMEVATANRAKDIKGRVTRYEHGLRRFGGTLPTVVDG